MVESFEKARKEYFNLRYIKRITDYSRLCQYLGEPEEKIREKYLNKGGLEKYYFEEIQNKCENITEKVFIEIKDSFAEYAEIERKYNNNDREDIFLKYDEIVSWFNNQKNMCGYCGISQDELNEIVRIRDGNFTLNNKKKRKNGILEIEQRNPIGNNEKSYTSFENLILACPLCNNAKSNLIDEVSWREIFVDSMRKYYEKLLGKKLRNPKK